jgi:hypothetical protein
MCEDTIGEIRNRISRRGKTLTKGKRTIRQIMHCKLLQGKVTIEQHEPGMNLEGKQFLSNALHVMKLIMCNILSTLPNALHVMKLIMCNILSTLPNALPVMKLIMCDMVGYYIRYTQSRKVGKANNKKNWKQGNQRF